jgi:hypothetical protein
MAWLRELRYLLCVNELQYYEHELLFIIATGATAFPCGPPVLGASGASPAAATPSSLVSSPLALVEEEKVEDSAEDLNQILVLN